MYLCTFVSGGVEHVPATKFAGRADWRHLSDWSGTCLFYRWRALLSDDFICDPGILCAIRVPCHPEPAWVLWWTAGLRLAAWPWHPVPPRSRLLAVDSRLMRRLRYPGCTGKADYGGHSWYGHARGGVDGKSAATTNISTSTDL